jgi:hypothetical protein
MPRTQQMLLFLTSWTPGFPGPTSAQPGPQFSAKLSGTTGPYATFLKESRTRGTGRSSLQKIQGKGWAGLGWAADETCAVDAAPSTLFEQLPAFFHDRNPPTDSGGGVYVSAASSPGLSRTESTEAVTISASNQPLALGDTGPEPPLRAAW